MQSPPMTIMSRARAASMANVRAVEPFASRLPSLNRRSFLSCRLIRWMTGVDSPTTNTPTDRSTTSAAYAISMAMDAIYTYTKRPAAKTDSTTASLTTRRMSTSPSLHHACSTSPMTVTQAAATPNCNAW